MYGDKSLQKPQLNYGHERRFASLLYFERWYIPPHCIGSVCNAVFQVWGSISVYAFWKIDVVVRQVWCIKNLCTFVEDASEHISKILWGSTYAYVEIPKNVNVKERGVMHWLHGALHCIGFANSITSETTGFIWVNATPFKALHTTYKYVSMRHAWYITYMFRIFCFFMINTGKWHILRSSTYAYVAISLKKVTFVKE